MSKKMAWIAEVVRTDLLEPRQMCVVFAETDKVALQIAYFRLECTLEDVQITRCAELDKWAEGNIPKRLLVEQYGFGFVCDGCEQQIDTDSSQVVEVTPFIFCSNSCRAERDGRIFATNEMFRKFQAHVQQIWPRLTFTRFCGGWPITTPAAYFGFPGSQTSQNRVLWAPDGHLLLQVHPEDQKKWRSFCEKAHLSDAGLPG